MLDSGCTSHMIGGKDLVDEAILAWAREALDSIFPVAQQNNGQD